MPLPDPSSLGAEIEGSPGKPSGLVLASARRNRFLGFTRSGVVTGKATFLL